MKKRSVNIIILVLILAVIAVVVYELIPKYPTPSYEVADYETMAKLFAAGTRWWFMAIDG